MAKKPATFRDLVLVTAETRGPTMHDFAKNPHASWGWYAADALFHGGFERLTDAKADAARVLGPVTWGPKRGTQVEGRYGPHMTPDEFLKHRGCRE